MKSTKINIPEGFEIDKDKSTFEEIFFKPIKEELLTDFNEICDKLFLGNTMYWLHHQNDMIKSTKVEHKIIKCDVNSAYSEKQLKKLLAINKLLTVAVYCNGLFEKDKEKVFYIDGNINISCATIEFPESVNGLEVFTSYQSAEHALKILSKEDIELITCLNY